MKSLSLIQLDEKSEDISYLSGSNSEYPRLIANGKEVSVVSEASEEDIQYLTKKIITSGLLKNQVTLMNIRGLLNDYRLLSSFANVIYDNVAVKYNEDNVLYDLVASLKGILFTGRDHPKSDEPSEWDNWKDLVIISKDTSENTVRLPVVEHQKGYQNLYTLFQQFNSIIGAESAENEGWIKDLNDAMVVKMEPKPSNLAEGVEDKTNLIKEHQVVDYISFDSCRQNVGSSGISYPVGDLQGIYKNAEIDNPAYQFMYINSTGTREPVYWQETSRELRPEYIQLVKEGSMIQLVISRSLNMKTDIIFDNEVVLFNNENVKYGYHDERCKYETVVVRAEEGLYNTDNFYIEVSPKRLVLYPKDDFPEYRIESAILTNVI